MADDEIDTSISFIDNPFAPNTSEPAAEKQIEKDKIRVSPDIIDPTFLNFIIEVPRKIEKIFKEVEKIKFVYKIIEGNVINIKEMSSSVVKLSIFADNFEDFIFSREIESNLIFIFGRQSYKSKLKALLNKEYKESIKKGTKFSSLSCYDKIKTKFYEFQIDNCKNIMYIDDADTLHKHIRNAVSIVSKDSTYIPKVKTFKEEKKTELMKSLLKNIPGVSDNVSESICEKYNTFESLRRALLDSPEDLYSIRIYDNEKINYRNLPEKIVEKLKVAFLGENPDLKI